ncbi:BZ3500_MvSof-1268-A1-R1_Chr4-3g07400 [Microbotryum saponariae]|uniref:Phospholipid-transporting ATPase n=1 Tax=Microbotryum saponariae TaxID=289078 RepID=A0A2X0M4W4_9BASI|nr:BZ3500_MvSof-1268-A1-R1_Chr4-3g07400 [Microbotryum saponariae]SDA07063.1 BZ3501_MvSof-1269-A2-R1_Chr4-2g07109 [Microbotryum saponariae]
MVEPIPTRGPMNRWSRSWARLNNWSVLSVFDPKRRTPQPRSVLVNVPVPSHATMMAPKVSVPFMAKLSKVELPDGTTQLTKRKRGFGSRIRPAPGWIFESNQVLTSKYNVITFLPRNLVEQFRRIANIFFLDERSHRGCIKNAQMSIAILVVLQFFPRFTTVNPGLSALPLLAVLTITALKDGYEDLKRHQSDRSINNIKVLALRGTFHNPNATRIKSRTFTLPAFIRNIFVRRSLIQEAEAAEDERQAERKKGFWGKRKIRMPKQKKAVSTSETNSIHEQESSEIPRDAPGGGNLQSAKKKSAAREAQAPERHERLDGDHYADDEDHATSQVHGGDAPHPGSEPHHEGAHFPHLGGHHYSHAVWAKECWEDLRVGDFVRLRGDEPVPAGECDYLVICATSEEENVCYVETKNLDGETNLKSRHAVPELTHLRTSTLIETEARFTINAEAADVNMFNYNAAVILEDGRLGKDGKPLRCPVNLNTVLLRGTVVRNTDWVIGVVVMSGRDTKIVLNSGGTPSKRSKVERLMNPMVFINLALLAAMCIMCAIVDHFLEKAQYPEGAYWLYGADRGDDNPNINALITFANAMIAFQNIVPISLYISIEFVRLLQAFFIYADNEICYRNGTTKHRTIARSWNLSDDLGQIEYVFSDKTGTLTQNAMIFQQCSVAGKVYRGDGLAPAGTVVPGANRDSSSTGAPTFHVGSASDAEKGDASSGLSSDDHDKKNTKLADTVLAPFHDARIGSDLADRDAEASTNLYAFFSNLALCHTVLAAEEDGLISYKAQSPDEAALVQAAADVGFVFLGRDKDVLRIQTPHDDDVVEYVLLNVLEFTSSRKRMSVVVRRVSGEHAGQLYLLSKGADNVIFERLAPGSEHRKKATDKHLEEFANEGLRTLCLAYKELDEDQYEAWEREFHEATTLIDGREEAIEAASERIETNLVLLGATAIEDRLQDGVPEAIADLKRAGLKIWVATGDKVETAIAIGKTCNLLSRDMNVIIVRGGEYNMPSSAYSQIRNALEKFFDVGDLADRVYPQPPGAVGNLPRPSDLPGGLKRHNTRQSGLTDIVGDDNGQRPGGYGLVIDGATLRHAFAEPYTKQLMLELATRCRAVICCRTSPLQKALIVRLVKDGLGAMCLAIGDGANDVSMIQAADIGVGVAGEEGLQAVNSSDYAIGQFRYLQRLLLVHGHWSYMRNANMIVNFFYKEIIGIGILFWFQFYCGYSATTVYEYTYLLFWNVFWTLLPVIAIGVFDRSVSDRVLMQVPELYVYGRKGALFGLKRFTFYMLDGIYQSAVIYFFLAYAYDTTTARRDGYDIQMYEFSTVMAISAVIAANLYNGLNTKAWTWWVAFSVFLGPVLILLYTAVYSAFSPSFIWTYVYGNNQFLWPSVYYWLGLLFTIVLSLLPRYLYRYYKENYYPTDVDILQWTDKQEPKHDWVNDPYMPQRRGASGPATTSAHDIYQHDNGSAHADDTHPIFAPGRPSLNEEPNSFPLGHRLSRQSTTHDMSTGLASSGQGRGFNYDEQPPAPLSIARYTSRTSDHSSIRTRPRKGSLRLAGVELNPFARSPSKTRTGSVLNPSRLFSGRRSAIPEGNEATTPTRSPIARSPRPGQGGESTADYPMIGGQLGGESPSK